jgi:hypothetical protein
MAASPTLAGTLGAVLGGTFNLAAAPIYAGTIAADLYAFYSDDYITLLIGGIRRNDYLKPDGISIDRQLNGVDSCTLTLQDDAEIYVPLLGQKVEVFEGTDRRFAGLVEETDEGDRYWGEFKREVHCGGWKRILDRRIIFAEYIAGYNIAGIVLDILGNWLIGEGLTMRHVDAGPTFAEKIVFQGVTIAQAFDQLAALSGYDWYVDWDKDIHFSLFAGNGAPFSITDDSTNWRNLHVKKSLRDYRNVQYVRNNTGLAPLRTDTFTGDGMIRFFVTKYPLWAAPTVTVDGVPKTVGLLGVDNGTKDWYWIGPSSYGVENLAPDAPLAFGAVLAVTYPTDFPNVVSQEDTAQIAARAAAEGSTGRYEAIGDLSDISEEATALAIATGLLARYGSAGPPTDADYETDEPGLEPGQIQPFSVTAPAIADNLLIESISSSWVDQGDSSSFFRHQVRATSGYCQGDWRAYWLRLAEKARRPKPVELETHSWDMAETINGVTPVPLATGTDMANPVIIQRPGIIQFCAAAAKTAPTGAAAVFDIKLNGVSIFTAGLTNHLIIPAGSTAVVTKTDFGADAVTVNRGDVLTIDVEQIGSTIPGQDITVYLSILPTGFRQA